MRIIFVAENKISDKVIGDLCGPEFFYRPKDVIYHYYDNSVIECFFGNLKTEIGDLDQYKTVQALIDRIEQYIKYYNERRIQLGLDGMSPVEYRESKMRVSSA